MESTEFICTDPSHPPIYLASGEKTLFGQVSAAVVTPDAMIGSGSRPTHGRGAAAARKGDFHATGPTFCRSFCSWVSLSYRQGLYYQSLIASIHLLAQERISDRLGGISFWDRFS